MSNQQTTPKTPAAGARQAERRAWVRYPTDLPGSCQPLGQRRDDNLWWSAQVRDLSAGGIGLVVSRRFEVGTILSVELPSTTQGPSVSVLARVVRCAALADGRWLIGCEFASPLSEDDVRALAGPNPGRNGHDPTGR